MVILLLLLYCVVSMDVAAFQEDEESCCLWRCFSRLCRDAAPMRVQIMEEPVMEAFLVHPVQAFLSSYEEKTASVSVECDSCLLAIHLEAPEPILFRAELFDALCPRWEDATPQLSWLVGRTTSGPEEQQVCGTATILGSILEGDGLRVQGVTCLHNFFDKDYNYSLAQIFLEANNLKIASVSIDKLHVKPAEDDSLNIVEDLCYFEGACVPASKHDAAALHAIIEDHKPALVSVTEMQSGTAVLYHYPLYQSVGFKRRSEGASEINMGGHEIPAFFGSSGGPLIQERREGTSSLLGIHTGAIRGNEERSVRYRPVSGPEIEIPMAETNSFIPLSREAYDMLKNSGYDIFSLTPFRKKRAFQAFQEIRIAY